MIGIHIDAGFFTTTSTPIEAAYLNGSDPWIDEASALAGIPAGSRYKYMFVNIAGELYWFIDDLTTLQPIKDTLFQTAEEVSIEDIGEYYISEHIEGALQELGAMLKNIENPFTLQLPASIDVAGRIAGAVIPEGWSLSVDNDINLKVTHTVNNRIIADVVIFEVDGTTIRKCIPFDEAYTGILANGQTITIEGLNPTALELVVHIFFS